MTALTRLKRIDSPSDLVWMVDLVREWLRGPEDLGLRRAFADWVRQIAEWLVRCDTAEELLARAESSRGDGEQPEVFDPRAFRTPKW